MVLGVIITALSLRVHRSDKLRVPHRGIQISFAYGGPDAGADSPRTPWPMLWFYAIFFRCHGGAHGIKEPPIHVLVKSSSGVLRAIFHGLVSLQLEKGHRFAHSPMVLTHRPMAPGLRHCAEKLQLASSLGVASRRVVAVRRRFHGARNFGQTHPWGSIETHIAHPESLSIVLGSI
jgi:hypothetical protein